MVTVVIDVRKYLNKDKLDIDFVKGLSYPKGIATIVNITETELVFDNNKPKDVVEVVLDFAQLGVVKKFIMNITSLSKLFDEWGFDAEKWIGKQVRPVIDVFRNNLAGVVLLPEPSFKTGDKL